MNSFFRPSLWVTLIDTNENMQCINNSLLVLPEQFQRVPPHAVDIRISGVVPHDLDTKWDEKTLKIVKKWLSPGNNFHMEGEIELTLMNCIWITSVVIVEKLQSLQEEIRFLSIKDNLIEKNFGLADTKTLQSLREMANNLGEHLIFMFFFRM